MAIFRLECKIISRAQGKSALAASAYRAASKLIDERTGLTWGYEKKHPDLVHSEISLPAHAPNFFQRSHRLMEPC